MTKKSFKQTIALIFITLMIAASSFAQGPMLKKVFLTVNVPYKLRMGDYMLSPGKYTIYQVSQSDLNLFYLYEGDLGHTPIASIRTVRIDHAGNRYPSHADIHFNFDEESSTPNTPVVIGWEIPGEDGFEIVSVVPRRSARSIVAVVK